MGKELVGHDLTAGSQGVEGAGEIARVPQGDGRHHEGEAAGAMLLSLKAAIAQSAEPVEADGALQRVLALAVVELGSGLSTQAGAFQPVEGEEGALEPTDLSQGQCQPVLARVGPQALQNQRGADHAGAD